MVLSPLGDSALVITLGDEVDDGVVNRVRAVADALAHGHFAGVQDIVPAFATVTVHFDLSHTGEPAEFEARIAEAAARAADTILRLSGARTIEVPVCYGGEYGPDLAEIAGRAGLTVPQVIDLHAGADYRVHAIGFVPGFAYLGGLPKKLHTPRRATPRPLVPAGAVGIGGAQSGVYPISTPGGWNLVGRTPLAMFDPNRAEPAVLRAGDRVKFRAIPPEEFAAWK